MESTVRRQAGQLHVGICSVTLASFLLCPFTFGVAQAPLAHNPSSLPAILSPVQSHDDHEETSREGLGADDLVEITVSYCPELTHNFRVSADGTLSLPLLHQPLMVQGLTPVQVAKALSSALLNDHILIEPVVNVSVIEYRSRPISIVGAVNHPITYQATNRSNLIEALAKTGGLSPTAGGSIIVTSQPGNGGEKIVRTIAVKDLISGTISGANVVLVGGEEVRVPEADRIFVAGNVRRPGTFSMQTDSDTTVMKAVALSSGLEAYTSNVAFIYRKRAVGNERDEIKVPIKQIMARHASDVTMRADDILYVPTNDGKKLTAKVLSQMAGFGQTAESGLLLR